MKVVRTSGHCWSTGWGREGERDWGGMRKVGRERRPLQFAVEWAGEGGA